MLAVDMPGESLPGTGGPSEVTGGEAIGGNPFGLTIGLDGASRVVDITTPTQAHTRTLTNSFVSPAQTVVATYFSGGDDVVANPIEPILPLERSNVSLPGKILRGALFYGGSFSETPGLTPLTSAPVTEQSTAFPGFYSDVPYPTQNWGMNFYDRLQGRPDQLLAVPGQYVSDRDASGKLLLTGTLRRYASMQFQLFYVDESWATTFATGLKAAMVAAAPEIAEVRRDCPAAGRVCAYVVDKANVGIQKAILTYLTYEGTAPNRVGTWRTLEMVPGAGNPALWVTREGEALPAGAGFMIQALNRAGRASLNTSFGHYFDPAAQPNANAKATQLSLAGVSPAVPASPGRYGMVYGQPATFTVRLGELAAPGAPVANQLVSLKVDGALVFAQTNSSGEAALPITLRQLPGAYTGVLSFAGSADYRPTALSVPIDLLKEETRLTLSAPSPAPVPAGGATGIVATLTTALGEGIPDQTIFIVGQGQADPSLIRIESVKTGQDGQAVLGAVDWPAGKYTITAYFGGEQSLPDGDTIPADPVYLSSAAVTTLAVELVVTPPLPNTLITAGPSGTTSVTPASFAFTSIGGVAPVTFECKLDAGPWEPCTSVKSYSGLSDGQHTFQVRAVDSFDGVTRYDPSPATRTWGMVTLYRATQQGARVWIERNVGTALALYGLSDVDGKPKDGWSLVASTNDGTNGQLRGFYVREELWQDPYSPGPPVSALVPYVIVYNAKPGKDARCMLLRPYTLKVVENGEPRLVEVVQDAVACPAP